MDPPFETGDLALWLKNKYSWNIAQMETAGQATWPANTTKCYYDVNSNGPYEVVDEDGNCFYPFDDDEPLDLSQYNAPSEMAAMDYFVERGPPVADDNYGWPEPLDADEYPLEIQCSSCFL